MRYLFNIFFWLMSLYSNNIIGTLYVYTLFGYHMFFLREYSRIFYSRQHFVFLFEKLNLPWTIQLPSAFTTSSLCAVTYDRRRHNGGNNYCNLGDYYYNILLPRIIKIVFQFHYVIDYGDFVSILYVKVIFKFKHK